MAIYAIGDLQGHLAPFHELLNKVHFNDKKDQLWLTGDLVNRGPESLKVLRFVISLGDSVKTVLGNHDLHLLSVAAGVSPLKKKDTFHDILKAPDLKDLTTWLRQQPLLHINKEIRAILVHAGIHPRWTRKSAAMYAKSAETLLKSDNYLYFLENIYLKETKRWSKSLKELEQLQFISNSFTHMRFCNKAGELDFKHKGPPGSQPEALTPWFRHPERRCKNWRIIFGHWAALGFLQESNVISLDSGCSWGRKLTAIRLDEGNSKIWSVDC